MPDLPLAQLIDRRALLRGMAVGSAGFATVLAACTLPSNSESRDAFVQPTQSLSPRETAPAVDSTRPAGPPAASASSGFPAIVPYVPAVQPDLAGTSPLVDDGYLNYPPHPRRMSTAPPGSGSSFNVLSFITSVPPTPLDQNPTWQEVNRRLNATMRIDLVSPADYPARLGTLMASGDTPDMWPLFFGLATAPNLSSFLAAQAADLTPFVGGDHIKDYPNLATIPDYAWRNSGSVIGDKVYLLPIRALSPVGPFTMVHNSAIWDKEIGADYQPRSAGDFKKVLLTLNRPREGRYAIGGYPTQAPVYSHCLLPVAQCFGAPRAWRLTPDGTLLKDWETDEFKATVDYVRDLFASGLFNPDQPTFSVSTAENEYLAGRIVVFHQVLGTQFKDTALRGRAANPQVSSRVMPPFAAEANVKPVSFPASAGQQANAFRKGNPERIKELLRICDWLATPFGTEEEQLLSYGLNGIDYTLDPAGNPISTARGPADSAYVNWRLISPPPPVLYFPEFRGLARVVQDAQRMLSSMTIEEPTAGHFSPTFLSRGRPLEATVTDGINDIVVGRRPMSDYDDLVRNWRSAGGDIIRHEYLDLIAARRSN